MLSAEKVGKHGDSPKTLPEKPPAITTAAQIVMIICLIVFSFLAVHLFRLRSQGSICFFQNDLKRRN
jgi:hypothetical protein